VHPDDLLRIPADAGISATTDLIKELLDFLTSLAPNGVTLSSSGRPDLVQVGTVDIVGSKRTISLDPSMVSAFLPYGPFNLPTVL
jgi:hypothetical protein